MVAKMQTPSVVLPEVPISGWTTFDKTAPGLFAYRQMQAIGLLQLPDFGGGDMNCKERKEALRNAVSFLKPLAALSLFLGVVALEDFMRDLTGRLAENQHCQRHFPDIVKLRADLKSRSPEKFFKQIDKDPIQFTDPEEVNQKYRSIFGVEPIPKSEYWHLRDLALLRHTVAHHAAVIRSIDVARFGHFVVKPDRVINPPPDFVQAELLYIYRIGRTIETSIRGIIFETIIKSIGSGWSKAPNNEINDLIEFFSYFGHIESTNSVAGYTRPGSLERSEQDSETKRIKSILMERCISDLVRENGP